MSNTPAYTEAWLPAPDGLKVYTRTYAPASPARAAILFIHGFAEYIASYESTHSLYAQQGIAVFAYDQRGFGRTALDAEHRSRESAYGRSSGAEQLADLEWWLRRVKDLFPRVPLFLVGPSMGGALSLAFVARAAAQTDNPAPVSGVIATSPFLRQTEPIPGFLRILLKLASIVLPTVILPLPADRSHYTHDDSVNEALDKDPMCLQKGSFKLLHDMLGGGERVLQEDYKSWPRSMPVLIIHGTADKIASFHAAKRFYDKLDGSDKEFVSIEDGYHELGHDPFNGIKESFVEGCISWILKRSDK